ncbi:transposase [Holdemania filiformis]|uniref:transposase n=1 Tax=Holdemania filiformis TaxID=61171 RepID=UPI0034CED6E5
MLPDRSKRTLSRYLDSISKTERDRVLFVTIDMWEPYRDIAHCYFKNAEVAVDPFHVTEHLTLAFTRIRVDIMNQSAYQSPAYYLLKKWHKLLESDSYNLDNDPRYNPFFQQKLNYRDLYTMRLTLNPSLTRPMSSKKNTDYSINPVRSSMRPIT